MDRATTEESNMRSDQMPTKRHTCELCVSNIHIRDRVGYCLVVYAYGVEKDDEEHITAMNDAIINDESTACNMYTEKQES